MYTKEDLKRQLQEMGLKETDTLLIHSSMRAMKEVKGGADVVLDAWMEYFEEGLLLLPTHTWGSMSTQHCVYDPETEPACVGILPNLFMKRKGVCRSLHPTHSIAAFGKESESFILGEENHNTPCSPNGCYNRLREKNAFILLLGVNHSRNTFIHAVEEVLGVPERFTKEPTLFQIKKKDGTVMNRLMYRHYNKNTAHISECYTKLEDAFYENQVAKQVSVGGAKGILCEAKGIFEVTKKVLSHEINCLIEREEIPCEWWR